MIADERVRTEIERVVERVVEKYCPVLARGCVQSNNAAEMRQIIQVAPTEEYIRLKYHRPHECMFPMSRKEVSVIGSRGVQTMMNNKEPRIMSNLP